MVHSNHVKVSQVPREANDVQGGKAGEVVHERGNVEAGERDAAAEQDVKLRVEVALGQLRAERHDEDVDGEDHGQHILHYFF